MDKALAIKAPNGEKGWPIEGGSPPLPAGLCPTPVRLRDLRARFAQHQAGDVPSTAARRPFELVYYEACRNIHDAAVREKYLKTAWGKRYLKTRLRTYLAP